MINQQILEEVLAVAMSSGGDFAEIYAENTKYNTIQLVDGKIDRVVDNTISGVGVRVFLGERTVYATTTDLTRNGLIACAANAAQIMGELKSNVNVTLSPVAVANNNPVRINPTTADMKYRTDILKSACFAAKEYSDKISQVQGTLLGVDHSILVANSEGLLKEDKHVRTRIIVNSTASDNGENQSGSCAPGRGMGMELFDLFDPKEIGIKASKQALVNLSAGYCPAGQMTVAIENGFGGVIFHEACGHSLEATQVGVGTSEMCGKLGQKIANEKVTAIDDGTIIGGWGSGNIDDEGNPTQRNVLIENGILKNYMIDRLGSRRMGMPMTGNSRRQGYSFEPTSRMTNTFIDNGPDSNMTKQ